MNLMKNYITIISKSGFIIALALWLCACADLDMPNDGRVSYDTIFSNYTYTKRYFTKCIAIPAVGFTYDGSSPLASYCDEAQDASDMVSGGVYNWYNNLLSPTNNPLGNAWGTYYTLIGSCNTFLKYMNDPKLSVEFSNPDEKNGFIAQVRVARAYYYLQLIKRYGGVPIIDTPYEIGHDFSKDKRSSFEEVADFIISECNMALATKETEGSSVGFRWAISNDEQGIITRAFAYAVKSQTALYAASPLWNTGSKYTWEKATTITKEALDQCLAHGFQLYNTPVDPGVAQNPYAYYFITPADGSRSWDKETIYQSSARSLVWQYAGLPITAGMSKAGPGPSQELVDSYEMQATGQPPILGYSDASHLKPVPNPASGYDANQPYTGRDPRFYASIYYNGAPQNLNTISNIPFTVGVGTIMGTNGNNGVDITKYDKYWEIWSRSGEEAMFSSMLHGNIPNGINVTLEFDYQLSADLPSNWFIFFKDVYANNQVMGLPLKATNGIDPDNDKLWAHFSANLWYVIGWGWGKDNTDYDVQLLFYFRESKSRRLLLKNYRIVVESAPTLVETAVGGNCGISNLVNDVRFTRTGYYMRKFNNYKSDNMLNADGYMRIFRLAELYLNFAEAAYQSAGPDAPVASTVGGGSISARDAVNAVRERANMPDFPAGMAKTDFETKYRNERRVELAFEEHRFFDVRRWKILNQTDGFVSGMKITNNGSVQSYQRIKLADRGTNADKYLIFPINTDEVQKMETYTGGTWQNPGW